MSQFVSNNASLNASRSRFALDHTVKSTYQHGYLYPVGDPIEVLPGDSMKVSISHLTRMSTPIFPIFDNITQSFAAAFIPKRILFNKTKQFYGEAEDFGIATEVTEPTVYGDNICTTFDDANLNAKNGFAAAFGLISNDGQSLHGFGINALPIRAFLSFYNSFFRDEVFCPQYLWDKDATSPSYVATLSGVNITGNSSLPKVRKANDLFTTTLPWQQKGDPCGIENPDLLPDGTLTFSDVLGDTSQVYVNDEGKGLKLHSVLEGDDVARYASGIKVQGSTANLLFTINELKYATAYQNYLTRLGHFGSKYGEYMYSFFGVKIPDASQGIPQFLGHFSTRINIEQVLQTTGHASGSSSTLGQPGANSVTGKNGYLFNASFTEPGYVVIVTYFKHDRTYAQGINPIYCKKKLLDYYNPSFANIGDVPISKEYLYFDGNSTAGNFGFQEPWFEYRQISNTCRNMLSPSVPNSLDFMTLTEKYANMPVLGASFVEEDRTNLARCLTTGVNGIDYICDTLVKVDATRVMPLHSNEGGRLGVL